MATARVVEHAVITAPNDAAKAAAAHAAVVRVEAEQARAHRQAVEARAAAQKAARAAATRRTAPALARRKTATRENAEKSAERWLLTRSPMSEAVDVGGGRNITPPGEDLGTGTVSIPVGDWGIETLGTPGHEGPPIDILGNPGHGGPSVDILGNPGSDQGPIINADDPTTDGPEDGPKVPYDRVSHYGGAATNSPAGQDIRAAPEGQPCPRCGKTMVSGTDTAPIPEHSPPLVLHFYNYGGWQMTSEQARACARSAEAFDGAMCTACQSSQGAGLSQYSRLMKELFQL